VVKISRRFVREGLAAGRHGGYISLYNEKTAGESTIECGHWFVEGAPSLL
jgi:hypothetical protein